MKYSGLSRLTIEELDEYNIPHVNGIVTGSHLINDLICGDLIENIDCSFTFEWITLVYSNTIKKIK